MLRGVVLAIVELLFPAGVPSLSEFAGDSGTAISTFRRAATWLLLLLPGLLASRRPGPRDDGSEQTEAKRRDALEKLADLRSWLTNQCSDTATNNCYSPEAKRRIATLSEETQRAGTLSYKEIALLLSMNERQLLRIRRQVEQANGGAPEPESRRPAKSGELAEEIQKLIVDIQKSAHGRSPWRPADIRRILEKNYGKQLLLYHGRSTIDEATVQKYMIPSAVEKPTKDSPKDHPRGSYEYPEPFQQVAIDTSYFKLYGVTYYLITVLEIGGRLNLITRVFLHENTAAVLQVLEEYLEKFPGIGVVVIDRGTPYLNGEVKELLEARGKLRLVCPPATPTAKAACERHFRTLKDVIRAAVREVMPENPGYSREQIAVLLELAATIFKNLYHQIPQAGIDGKSPAERIESFDPVRAARLMGKLFERSVDRSPARDYALQLHDRFQLPGSPRETVRRLKWIGTPALRRTAEKVAECMGPPFPKWMYDPLGYFAAKAREIREARRRAYLEARYSTLKAKQDREDERRHQEQLARERQERDDHPELFVDRWLALAVSCAERKFEPGLRHTLRNLGALLRSLGRQLGRAMSSDLERLRGRVRKLSGDANVTCEILELIDAVGVELGFEKASAPA